MAKLTPQARKKLASSQFAGPNRTYPIPDARHAANAKGRATQAFNAGRITASQRSRINTKANAVINRTKKK